MGSFPSGIFVPIFSTVHAEANDSFLPAHIQLFHAHISALAQEHFTGIEV